MPDKKPSLLSTVFAFIEKWEMVRLAEYSDMIPCRQACTVATAEEFPFSGADVSFLRSMHIDPWN